MTAPAHIILLRHGETTASAEGLFTGRADIELNDAGRAGARAWAECFSGEGVAAWHSPLLRTAETAALARLESEPLDDLVEWDLGTLEGQNSERYRAEHPNWNLFRDGPPGNSGESVADVVERVQRLSGFVTSRPESVVVLVGHGQLLRVLVSELIELSLSFATKVAFGPARVAMLSWRPSVGSYVLTGWNRGPDSLEELTTGNS